MGKVDESGQVIHRDTWSSKWGSSGSVLGISPCFFKNISTFIYIRDFFNAAIS